MSRGMVKRNRKIPVLSLGELPSLPNTAKIVSKTFRAKIFVSFFANTLESSKPRIIISKEYLEN